MADVFISYSKSDRSYALDLAEELRVHGISVWIDQTGIGGAKNWAGEIVEAINACSTVLCLLSPHSITSHNVAKEIHLASEKQKTILPVFIEQVTLPPKLEYPLAGLQRVFFRDRPAIFEALGALRNVAIGHTPSPEHDAADIIRIAVLPFDDLSPQHDNQWFADGMMDELISTLGSLEHVKVPPRADVLSYRGHKKKSRDIAREVGVRYLIEGGVRKGKEKIRITASLTDSVRGEQLWTNKFDGTFDDVFDFQESVSNAIVTALKIKLTSEEKGKVEDHGTQNAEAYELYLKGRHKQYFNTQDQYISALHLYEEVLNLDPAFVSAHISIALVCCAYFRDYSKSPKWLERAEQHLAVAKEAAGETSRTMMISGMIAWLKGKREQATEDLAQSASQDPKNYNALNLLGAIHMEAGEYREAVAAFERVVTLVENTQSYFNLLNALTASNDFARIRHVAMQALPVFQRHLLREPNDLHAQLSYAFVLLWAGNLSEASAAAEQLRVRSELDGHQLYNLACLYNNLEQPELLTALLRRAVERGFRDAALMKELLAHIEIGAATRTELNEVLHNLQDIIQSERRAA